MTIKEFNQIVDPEIEIKVAYAGSTEPLNRYNDSLQMLAYGDFVVESIGIIGGKLEATVKTVPVKAE